MGSYSRNGLGTITQHISSIISVDLANQTAEAMINDGSSYIVHFDHLVGAVQVVPSVGDQWIIDKGIGGWKLLQRLPFNDPPATEVTRREGMVRLGSGNGPVELTGTEINAHAPIILDTKATTARPTAVNAGVGAMIFDTTLNKPIWSNGSTWVDAAGSPV